jgi:hypothetical protein
VKRLVFVGALLGASVVWVRDEKPGDYTRAGDRP